MNLSVKKNILSIFVYSNNNPYLWIMLLLFFYYV
nr:MAG TPA: hypothetical protein [Caudoviricetes sp.]